MISTIGYEGSEITQFISVLKRASIKLVIDVRDIPLSRKKGFSKNQLAEMLRLSGIEYIHLRGLGDPKEGRLAARSGNYSLFEKVFSKHMQTVIAKKDLSQAADLVRASKACLMCFEADHTKCHRSIVAMHLSRLTGLAVAPLRVSAPSIGRLAA